MIAQNEHDWIMLWPAPAWAWLVAIMLPCVTALAVGLRPRSKLVFRIAPWSAVPVILMALFADQNSGGTISNLMLGVHLGLDGVSRVFLFFVGMLWWLSGWFATSYMLRDPRRSSFMVFFLLAMSGNLGLVLAEDMVTFYVFFALMSFTSYALVVHDRTAEALRAGRVYLLLVVVGEVLLFSGLTLLAADAGTLLFDALPERTTPGPAVSWAIALVFLGLGIKAGILPLHIWLPLAHPAAPTPASAVLSGAMIKAGLIGWLKVLPISDALTTSPWGMLFIVIGVLSAYYGVLVGLTQRHPKTVLAYSSISQMGLIAVGLGVGLLISDRRDLAWLAVAAYALHHGLAKGTLFLGISVYQSSRDAAVRRRLCMVGMILGALALAGFPLTSGALAKTLLKDQVAGLPGSLASLIKILLSISAIGTTLLMLHFLRVIMRMRSDKRGHPIGDDRRDAGLWIPWAVLLSCVALATLLWPWRANLRGAEVLRGPSVVWAGFWPVFVAVVVDLVFTRLISRWLERARFNVPAGDILVIFEGGVSLIRRSGEYALAVLIRARQRAATPFKSVRARFETLPDGLATAEEMLRSWPVGGGLMFGVFLTILIVLLWP